MLLCQGQRPQTTHEQGKGQYLSFNGGADGGVELIQLVLQLQLVGLAVARPAVEETTRPMPGLLPPPRGVLPAGLQNIAHITKQLLLQALHALLHLQHTRSLEGGFVYSAGMQKDNGIRN